VLCIVIPKEDFQDLDQQQDFKEVKKRHDKEKRPTKCQLVPRQFLAGGASVWLNLGRKNLWEKLAGALPFGAFLLTGSDGLHHVPECEHDPDMRRYPQCGLLFL